MAYTQKELDDKFDKICQRIMEGESLRKILYSKKPIMSNTTFFKLLKEDPAKNEQYARAKEVCAERKFDSIEEDYMSEPQRDPESGRIDPAWVQLQRLKIDAKKWELSKLLPKKYGDKIDIDAKIGGEIILNVPKDVEGLGEV